MYAIHPGEVRAKDGDIHFITAKQLMDLYEVSPNMCCIVKDGWDRGYNPEFKYQFTHLYPRQDGNYKLPPISINN